MEMKCGEDEAWEHDRYESEYLWWWEQWNWEERIAPTLKRECLDVLVYGLSEY